MNDFPEVMTIEQVAEYLQLHPQVIYRHVKAGTLPASRIGRTIRFKKSVLDSFLEKNGWQAVTQFFNYVREQWGSTTKLTSAVATTEKTVSRDEESTVEIVEEPPRQNQSARFTADVD